MRPGNSDIIHALGVMSGTSMDGIDVACVRMEHSGLIKPNVGVSMPYPQALKEALRAVVADPHRAADDPLPELIEAVTRAHCDAVAHFFEAYPDLRPRVRLIGCHGQTVYHNPAQQKTRQLFDGALAAKLLDYPIICDFRQRDVLHGGQGAPLLPLYHQALLPHVLHALYADKKLPKSLVFLNIGGVANITWLGVHQQSVSSADAQSGNLPNITAFDTGPGNALLDDFMQARRGLDYDASGSLAAKGRVDTALVTKFLTHPYFASQPPKSLDRNAFHPILAELAALSDADGAATLVAMTVASIVRAQRLMPLRPRLWLVCGGGRKNEAIMTGLREALPGVDLIPVEAIGLEGDMIEAQGFALLALLSKAGLPISLPSTTGVPEPMTGGVLFEPPAKPVPEIRRANQALPSDIAPDEFWDAEMLRENRLVDEMLEQERAKQLS